MAKNILPQSALVLGTCPQARRACFHNCKASWVLRLPLKILSEYLRSSRE